MDERGALGTSMRNFKGDVVKDSFTGAAIDTRLHEADAHPARQPAWDGGYR